MIKLREGLWINPSYIARVERIQSPVKGSAKFTVRLEIDTVDERKYVVDSLQGDDPDRVLRAIEEWFPARDPDADGMDVRDMYTDIPFPDKE